MMGAHSGTNARGFGPRLVLLAWVGTMVWPMVNGCQKKKRSSVAAAPAGTTAPKEVPPEVIEKNEDVGEEVPPITTDTVASVDTEKAPAIKHLIFTASDTQEANRYKSEFLLVVRANEKSCIRLKVRPTEGIDAEIDDANFPQERDAACSTPKEEVPGKETETPTPKDEAAASLWDASQEADEARRALTLGGLEWGKVTEEGSGFSLATTRDLCSLRLFRMRQNSAAHVGDSLGLEKVVTKTGRLVHVSASAKVRVYVDEEYDNLCRTGATPGDGRKVPFGPLQQEGKYVYQYDSNGVLVRDPHMDLLTMGHIQTVALEAEKTLTTFSDTYGAISDVDGSKGIEIFISPEVNRHDFIKQQTHAIDHFRVNLALKPEDLARYNSETNPASNEGEIVYLWAPDPAGLYNYGMFPSANSLTSDYAIGHVAAQIMALIVTNKRLLERKKVPMESGWLLESLAYLASAYRGGNDYTFLQLSQYLTSRPQNLSLTEPLDGELIPGDYSAIASDEQAGFRIMFAWYLHSRLCGVGVGPCAKLKGIIDSDTVGQANIEAALSEPFEKTMRNFGLSVGVSLADRPAAAKAFWTSAELPQDFPAAPVNLPDLTEVRADDPPLTTELENNASAFHHASGREDRSQASPFPSRKMMIYQPILPDNDLDLKLAKNSVTYILVTGLIEKNTDVTAALGKSLNVVFIPLGDRDSAVRQIHVEKHSENAQLDVSPVNLTQLVDSTRTYYRSPEYAASVDMTVTPQRELWVLGSIDNASVNQDGSSAEINGVDSYNIRVNPCADLAGATLTACQAKTYHQVMIQVLPRDFPKEVLPMVLVTSTRLGIFRGANLYGRVKELDSEWQDAEAVVGAVCQSERSWRGGAGSLSVCANGDVTAAEYLAACSAFSADFACLGGRPAQALMFDAIGYIANGSYSVLNTNYLFSGPDGFPFYNNGTMRLEKDKSRVGYRSFRSFELERQFLKFGYRAKLPATEYEFYTVPRDTDFNPEIKVLSVEELNTLVTLKEELDTDPGGPVQNQADSSEAFQALCATYATGSSCKKPRGNTALDDDIKYSLSKGSGYRIVCHGATNCLGSELTQAGTYSTAWIPAARLVPIYPTGESYSTYFSPIEPENRPTTAHSATASARYCLGEDIGSRPLPQPECTVKPAVLSPHADIRAQLNVASNRFYTGCYRSNFGDDFDVCGDFQSFDEETNPEVHNGFYSFDTRLATDRVRARVMGSARRAGEVVGKPHRLYYSFFYVNGSAPTTLNVMVGGRRSSQGKYLLRVRQPAFQIPCDGVLQTPSDNCQLP